MPAISRKKRPVTTAKFLIGILFKLGTSFFGAALGGFVSQYLSNNPTGMLIFAALGMLGFIFIATAIVSGE